MWVETIAEALTLAGTGFIWWPAWQFSREMKLASRLDGVEKAERSEDLKELARLVAKSIRSGHQHWNKVHHYLLMTGFACLVTASVLRIVAINLS